MNNARDERVRRIILVGLGCVIAALGTLELAIWMDDLSGARAERLYNEADAMLARQTQPHVAGLTDSGMLPIAMSNLAEGLTSYAIRHPKTQNQAARRLSQVVELALSPKTNPYKRSLERVSDLGEHGLFLSHAAITLGAYRRGTGDRKYDRLNRRICEHLARRSLSEPTRIAPSFPGRKRWPADQAATLYGLWLFDKNHGTRISARPIREWLDYMAREGTDPATKLHRSEASRSVWYWKHPRGCALSWTSRYMARFAPAEGQRLWQSYKRRYGRNFLLAAAFDEYPAGVSAQIDTDSGPIFFGIGSAATALGWGAAAAVGDRLTYLQLTSAFAVAYPALKVARGVDERFGQVAFSPLATGIRLNAATQTSWYPIGTHQGAD